MTLYIDFESYSAVDIKTAGGYQYCKDDSTQVICMGWAFDQEEPTLWTPASGALPERIVKHVTSAGRVAAFNMQFDMRIWNWCAVRDFGWPELCLSQLVDIQALAACYQVPQSLAAAGEALKIPMPKDKAGTSLVKACCTPDKNGEQPFPSGSQSHVFQALFRYCLRDVVAMQQIAHLLPRQELIPQEQEIWELTVEMNARGLPVDTSSVQAIYSYLQSYIERTVFELPALTGGAVTTPGQVARILKWCNQQGFYIPNLQVDTVAEALCRPSLPAKVRRVLELRQELGRSSTAKYAKILDQSYNGHVYDNVRYHGAGTGRWTGMGFQMHNLPRASVEDPQLWIDKFITDESIDDPVGTAKALIRPMVLAPEGQHLIVADYASIENRLLAWAADDVQTLADFDAGLDQYKVMASARFNVPYEEVTKEMRRVGKVIILGCIAAGTQVLTSNGPMSIEAVQLTDKLWDGEGWVSHEGTINRGQRWCMPFCGTWFTPDHEIYFGDSKEEIWRHQGNILSEIRVICSAFGKFLNINHVQILQNATRVMTSCAHSAEKPIFTFWRILKKATVLNAVSADEKQYTSSTWKHIAELQDLVKRLLIDLSTDGTPLKLDALLKQLVSTRTTADAELECAQNGSATLTTLLYMLCSYPDLTTQNSSSTESTTTGIMNQVTYDSARAQKICSTHDILNSGKNHRFTILTHRGPVIVSNCGYGMGAKKFRDVALLQAQLELSEDEAKACVDTYRSRYPLVKALWANLTRAATESVLSGQKRRYKNTTFGTFTRNGIKWLAMQLPTGKALYYMDPSIKEELIKDYEYMGPVPCITHWGTNPYTKKWSRLKLIPGRITENFIQASAREVMAAGLLNVKKNMPDVQLIGSVHDEALGLVPSHLTNDDTMEHFIANLCKVSFLPGCNITAEGYFSKRYRKG